MNVNGEEVTNSVGTRDQVWEVFSAYDAVHWIPTKDPLTRFTTKYNTHSKLFQFLNS